MTEYRTSRLRMFGASVVAAFFLIVAAYGKEQSTLVRLGQAIGGIAYALTIAAMARTRICVGETEIAIRRLGKWFRANRADVVVKCKPMFAGPVNGIVYLLQVYSKANNKNGVAFPLSFYAKPTLEDLRRDLATFGAPEEQPIGDNP